MDDLISRTAAIECAINAVDDWDGGYNQNRETYINRYFEELTGVDAIPVEWMKAHTDVIAVRATLAMWQKEQEAR